MSILDWLEAIIKLGIPMSVLGWLMFNWLYGAGPGSCRVRSATRPFANV